MGISPVKVAVIGTNIGCKLHVRALQGAGFEVTALVGRNSELTKTRADYFGIPTALTSVEALLDSDVDAIVVASPPATHHPFTMSAIAAGKHVLCEKPFSCDLGQAREMRDAAREAGIAAHLVHPQRWHAHRAAVRDAVRMGTLGETLQASFTFDHFMSATGVSDLPDWWFDRTSGGGWLRNFASHGIDFARYVLGDFLEVSGTVHVDSSRGMKADDAYAIAFRSAGGAQGVMAGTCRAWDFYESIRITGTQGTVSCDFTTASLTGPNGTSSLSPSAETAESLLLGEGSPGEPRQRLPDVADVYEKIHSSDRGYAEQVCLSRAFRHRIIDPTFSHPAVATFDDGVAHMATIIAVEESVERGTWVRVSSSG